MTSLESVPLDRINSKTLRKRRARIVPYGWRVCEMNTDFIEPIPEQQEALDQAREYINSGDFSLQEICDWLERTTGKRITRRGLQLVMARDF